MASRTTWTSEERVGCDNALYFEFGERDVTVSLPSRRDKKCARVTRRDNSNARDMSRACTSLATLGVDAEFLLRR